MVMDPSSGTRITGMATGMDTDSLVKKLMQVEQIPLNQMKQKEQKYSWESDAYRQWNSDLFSFKTSTLFNMKLSGTYNTFDISSSEPTAITGTATGNTITGSYNIQVKNLAQAATFLSNGIVLDPTKPLNDPAQGSRALSADTSLSLSVVNPQTNQTQTATINISAAGTINDVIASINTAKDASGQSLGLQAIYDQNLQQFILRTKSTGASASIDLSANSSDPNAISFLSNTLGINTLTASGSNADIVFNGTELTNLSTNTATLMGVNFSFKNPTVDASGNPITSTVTVSGNVDAEVNNIKDFVSKYNDMLDKLNKAISEPVYKDYQPLTDDQRSSMSDTQITQWETKAKSGLMHNDNILSGLVNQMRSDMTTIVSNGSQYNSLASIGISSKSYQDKGKLYVDEDKLRAAIQNDPDAVKNLLSFMGDSSTNGIMNRLSDDFDQAVKKLTDKAGMTGNSSYDQSVIGKLLTQTETNILQKQDDLNRKEDEYYNQFAAMETAVNKYNSQGSWLMQSLSGAGGGQ